MTEREPPEEEEPYVTDVEVEREDPSIDYAEDDFDLDPPSM